ncbi:ATP-binding protein [Streptomyces cyaneochromogenes]|uniref:ATP-binding protein n=1 Tax=Streptomyces cyaneochromogenes TaxID=2496836 RepID=A0A3Q9EUR8_9ACTN|nr:AAA family ATPase [Streptomyces cyaneochromogenes]AZQ39545.1 ATP-binding protein [Streptomyces cyaneochromogenes]
MAHGSWQPNTEPRPLLERQRELHALDSALSDLREAADGVQRSRPSGLLAFTGPAGLGKTALLTKARARAAAQGFTVLSACGGQNEQELAFRLVRQLVQPALATMDEAERRTFLGSWYDIVAVALGLEAATDTVHAPDPTGVRDGLDWVMTRLATMKAPLVLLLDDLHWADLESLGWLASFIPRAADLPLLVLVAYRPDELPAEAAAFRTVVERHGNRPHPLARLSAAGVAQIVRDELGEGAADEFCDECWSVTGGSPFEAVELAIRLAEQNLKGAQEELATMRDLAAAVKGPGLIESLRGLGTTTLRFAHAAAVLGPPVSPELAATLAVIGSEDAVEAIGKLRAARILSCAQGPGGSLEFVHPLIATTIYRSIPSGLRVGLHDRAAEAVRAAGLGPTAAARHLLEVPCEGRREVVDCLREAAREYLRAGAPEAARRVLARALQEPPLPEDRAALLHDLACSTFLLDPTATVSLLQEALAETGLDPRLRASIVYRLTQALAHTDRLAEAATVSADEARLATHPRLRLRMQADHFVWSAFRADEPDSIARSRRLTRLAERLVGRGLEERYILGLRAWDALVRGEPRQTALACAEESLRGGLSWTDENRGFEVPVSVALVFMYCDQPRRAEELFTTGMAECERMGWRGSHLAQGQTLFGYIRYRRGCLPEAEEFVRAGLRTANRVAGAVPAQWFAIGILIQTLLARGRTAQARRLADTYHYGEVVPNAVIYPDPRTVYAELLLAEGRLAEAADLLSAVGEWLDARGWRNPSWCPWQLHLASALAPTAPGRALSLARDAVKRARDFGAASTIGQALHVEAEVTGGPGALKLHAEAVEHLEQSPAAYELARALIGHGAALSRSGRLQEAADRLYQGLEGAVHCGAEGLAARARQELSAAGMRPLPLRYAQADTLSAQERRTAELALQGLPLPVIAKELRLTEQGVRQLLSGVYRKVGTDAAGLAKAWETFPPVRP